MKRGKWLLFGVIPLLASLLVINTNTSLTKSNALPSPWIEKAIAPVGEDYSYIISYDISSIIAANASYPTSGGQESTTHLDGVDVFSTNAFIGPMDTFITMGTFSMIQGGYNLGRIATITIDIDETQYGDMSELGGDFGLQLREGRTQEFQNAENESAGPTAINNTTWEITWDLTWRTIDHPGFVPFFIDETRLDDISNFNLVAINPIFITSITITGTHFMEVSNGTPLRPAYFTGESFNYVYVDINTDNRIDIGTDEFNLSAFDTTVAYPIESMMEFTISSFYPYDDVHYLAVTTVKALVIAGDPYEDTLLIATPINPELTMPVDGKNWKSGLASLTYGGQDALVVDESVFGINYFAFGHQYVDIYLWNSTTYVPAYITNQGVVAETPNVGVNGALIEGNIMESMVGGSFFTATDTIDPVNPQNSYSTFTFTQLYSAIGLNSPYTSQGFVDSINFTLTVRGMSAFSGGGTANRFSIILKQQNGSEVDDTLRFFTLDSESTTVAINYSHLSAYQVVGFYIRSEEIKDLTFSFSVSVTGFEYFNGTFTEEMQAFYYARSFLTLTNGIQGASEDGVCDFSGDPTNDWSMFSTEYGYLSASVKSLFANNLTTMKSSKVENMLARYTYILNTDPMTYNDFMAASGGGGLRPVVTTTNNKAILPLLITVLSAGSLYWVIRKKQRRYE